MTVDQVMRLPPVILKEYEDMEEKEKDIGRKSSGSLDKKGIFNDTMGGKCVHPNGVEETYFIYLEKRTIYLTSLMFVLQCSKLSTLLSF